MAEVKVFLKNSIPSLSRLIVNYRKKGLISSWSSLRLKVKNMVLFQNHPLWWQI